MSVTVYVGAKRVRVCLQVPSRGIYHVMIGGKWYGRVRLSERFPRYWVALSTKGTLQYGPYNAGLPHNRLFPSRESAIIKLLEREGVSC